MHGHVQICPQKIENNVKFNFMDKEITNLRINKFDVLKFGTFFMQYFFDFKRIALARP